MTSKETQTFLAAAKAIARGRPIKFPLMGLQSEEVPATSAVQIVVTLVHGTFAKGAPWIQANGRLARLIRQQFEGRCRVEPFDWTGGNSVRRRWDATLDLRARLNSQRKMYPNARQFIIAHSHGGNIALYALADPDLARQVAGVACLATPFLVPTRRATTEPLLKDFAAPVAALTTGIMAALYVGLIAGQPWGKTLLVFGAVTVGLGGGLWLAEVLHDWFKRRANHLLEQMPRTAFDPQKLRIIRTPLDEAWAALAFTRMASGLLSLFWRLVTRPLWVATRWLVKAWAYNKAPGAIKSLWNFISELWQPKVSNYPLGQVITAPPEQRTAKPLVSGVAPKKIFGQVGSLPALNLGLADSARSARREQISSMIRLLLPVLYPLLAAVGSNWWVQTISLVLLIAYGVPALLAVIVSVLLVPFAVFVAVGLLLHGWDLPVGAPFLDVVAEPAPPGSWNVTQVHGQLAPGPTATAAGLSHGRAHDDPQVHAELLAWLQAGLPTSVTPTVSPDASRP